MRTPVAIITGAIGVVRSLRRGSEGMDEVVLTCLYGGMLTTVWACWGVLFAIAMIRVYRRQIVYPRSPEAVDGSISLAIPKWPGSALAFIPRCDIGLYGQGGR